MKDIMHVCFNVPGIVNASFLTSYRDWYECQLTYLRGPMVLSRCLKIIRSVTSVLESAESLA